MHTLVIDLQKIINACWSPFLANFCFLDQVCADNPIYNGDTFCFATASINSVRQILHAASSGHDTFGCIYITGLTPGGNSILS